MVAVSFERIHRSNLVGMGILPLQFPEGVDAQTLGLDGSETISLTGLGNTLKPGQQVPLRIDRADSRSETVPVRLRLDKDLKLSDDSIASIRTSGLIGDKFVSLSRGGSASVLAAGDTITETESAVDLGTLIGKYAFGGVK